MPTQQPSDYGIIKAEVTSLINNKKIDIRNLIIEINVHEDLFNTSMYCSVTLHDATNLISNFPILGFETIRLSFAAPARKPIDHVFRIYAVREKNLIKDNHQVYTLHGVSKEMLDDTQVSVSKSYKGMLISDIATDIQQNYLNSSFAVLETTKYMQHLVIPNMHPMKAINWLAHRAVSQQYNGANYLYFENRDGYNFQSVERLQSQNTVQNYIFVEAYIRGDTPGANYKPRLAKMQFVNVKSYKFEEQIDVLNNIMMGMYANRLYTFDQTRKSIAQKDWSMMDTYQDFIHAEPNSVKGRPTYLAPQGVAFSPDASVRAYPHVGAGDFPNQATSWMCERASQLQQIHNIPLTLTISGDSERKVGEMIEFDLPSPEPPDTNGQIRYDRYYRGRYLVSKVRHMIRLAPSQYDTIIECVKDSVFSPVA